MPPSDTGHSGLGRPPGRAGLRVALQALESEADDVEPAQPLTDEDQKEAAVQRAARARAARSGYTETAPAEESEAYSGFSFGSLGLLTLGTDLQGKGVICVFFFVRYLCLFFLGYLCLFISVFCLKSQGMAAHTQIGGQSVSFFSASSVSFFFALSVSFFGFRFQSD